MFESIAKALDLSPEERLSGFLKDLGALSGQFGVVFRGEQRLKIPQTSNQAFVKEHFKLLAGVRYEPAGRLPRDLNASDWEDELIMQRDMADEPIEEERYVEFPQEQPVREVSVKDRVLRIIEEMRPDCIHATLEAALAYYLELTQMVPYPIYHLLISGNTFVLVTVSESRKLWEAGYSVLEILPDSTATVFYRLHIPTKYDE